MFDFADGGHTAIDWYPYKVDAIETKKNILIVMAGLSGNKDESYVLNIVEAAA